MYFLSANYFLSDPILIPLIVNFNWNFKTYLNMSTQDKNQKKDAPKKSDPRSDSKKTSTTSKASTPKKK